VQEPQCVVITGAAQGIGRRTAEKFAETGYRLALVDLHTPDATLDSLRALGTEAFAYTGDITGRVPMGRFASADDIANAIVFLADHKKSGFINGHALAVDGGWTADGSWESLRLRHR